MSVTHKVNEKTLNLSTLAKKIECGDRFVCDKCGAELIIALTLQEAKDKNVSPGVYCPTNGKHLFVHFYLKETREEMFELFEKIHAKKKE